jgi:hypothetical protein
MNPDRAIMVQDQNELTIDFKPQPSSSPPYGVAFITRGQAFPYKEDDDQHDKRSSINVSDYAGLVIRMWGDNSFFLSVGIKSTDQMDYGFETKVQVNITPQPQEFYFPLSWFATKKAEGTYEGAQLNQLYVVTEFVFNPDVARTLHISSIRYTTNGYATNKIAPYVAFGGGWSTSLYFTNASGAQIKFPMNFIGLDGQPLSVPVPGSVSKTIGLEIGLGSRATSEIDISSDSVLSQGYAKLALPDDISGYSLLRQSIPGQPDQQAIIPFAETSTQSASLLIDESASITTALIVNIDNAANQVALSARDDGGQILGQATVPVPAQGSSAVVLRNLPGFSSIAGKKGSVDFKSTNGGNIAVLGLRFNGAAFTPIPARNQ